MRWQNVSPVDNSDSKDLTLFLNEQCPFCRALNKPFGSDVSEPFLVIQFREKLIFAAKIRQDFNVIKT